MGKPNTEKSTYIEKFTVNNEEKILFSLFKLLILSHSNFVADLFSHFIDTLILYRNPS